MASRVEGDDVVVSVTLPDEHEENQNEEEEDPLKEARVFEEKVLSVISGPDGPNPVAKHVVETLMFMSLERFFPRLAWLDAGGFKGADVQKLYEKHDKDMGALVRHIESKINEIVENEKFMHAASNLAKMNSKQARAALEKSPNKSKEFIDLVVKTTKGNPSWISKAKEYLLANCKDEIVKQSLAIMKKNEITVLDMLKKGILEGDEPDLVAIWKKELIYVYFAVCEGELKEIHAALC